MATEHAMEACDVENDPDMEACEATDTRLSRGQKKKLRQRAVATIVQPTVLAGKAQSMSSSSSTPVSGESSSEEEGEDHELQTEKHEVGSTLASETSVPRGSLPPGWPSPGAELLSLHRADTLPPLVGQHLRLAALPFPQPRDQLQWRILPLVRNALALADDAGELALVELARFVEGNLPPACLLRITSARLRALVELVVTRNVRHGRLRQIGKRFALPRAENPCVLMPHLAGVRLELLRVAWCTEFKRPLEVALRYACLDDTSLGPLWLCGELGGACRHEGRAESDMMTIGEVAVLVGGTPSWMSWAGAARGGMNWRLFHPPGMSQDAAIQLVRQVIEQETAAVAVL